MKWKNHNKRLIISNLKNIFKNKDVDLMNKSTYDLLYNLSGFIAHYDINGFKHHYQDLRVLIEDLKNSTDILNPKYYEQDFFKNEQEEYYKTKIEIFIEIKNLIPIFEEDINKYFQEEEKTQDINTINYLKIKHNLK